MGIVGQEGVLRPARVAGASVSWTERAERLNDFLSRESPLIVAWALLVGLWLFVGGGYAADSWLTLLGGRELLAHGLPHHDSLAILSHGHQWIDQQWLPQLFYYGLYTLGGFSLASHVNVLLFASAAGIGLVAARRRGASPSRVLVCALPALLLTARFIRAEVPAQVLFVLLLLLLVRESRRPSKLVLLAFPLVALWANVHGSAVLGAILVSLLGVIELLRALRLGARRRLARGVLLAIGAWPWLLATPYGWGVLDYYRVTLWHPAFAKYITEWQSPRLDTLWGATFFVAVAFAAIVVARRPRDFNAFEHGALLLTFVGGLLAVRSAIWFTYAVLILVPRALERLWPAGSGARAKFVPFRAALSTVLLGLCVFLLVRPATSLERQWPSAAARTVAAAARGDQSLRVFANEEYADWLLFREPSLRGRVAFDGRWEILSPRQMQAVVNFLRIQAPGWERVSRGYRLFVLDPKTDWGVVRTYLRRSDMHVMYRDKRVVVFERQQLAVQVPELRRTAGEAVLPRAKNST